MNKRNKTMGILSIVAAGAAATITGYLVINSVSHLKKNKKIK